MAARAALIVALLFVFAYVGYGQYINCANHAHCQSCTQFSSPLGTCEWCPQDTECHEPGSIYNPCSAGTSITNTSQCTPLPACPTGVDPSIYDSTAALDMIAFSLAAYNADPRTFQNFPPGTTINVTFTGTVPIEPHTVVNGYTATYPNAGGTPRIVVVFQGTASTEQLITEMLNAEGVEFKGFGPEVLVADYFLDAFETLEQAALNSLEALQTDYPDYDIYITGHSLGGALASLFALGSYTDGVAKQVPYLYTMGQPRVGNPGYAALHLQTIPNSFRLINNRDPVPHLPPEGPSSSSSAAVEDFSTFSEDAAPKKEQPQKLPTDKVAAWTAEREKTVKAVQKAVQKEIVARNVTGRGDRKVGGLLWAWHHGWEIWYPGGEYQNSVMCGNRFCCDSPTGEAHDCSDSLTFDCGSLDQLCVGDHHGYFLVIPNGWCNPTAGNPLITKRN